MNQFITNIIEKLSFKKQKTNDDSIFSIQSPLSLRINKSWDTFPYPKSKDKAIYVGRKKILHELKNWILFSSGGSLLISGVRGVGKTAFAYKTLGLAIDEDKRVDVIYINGASLKDDPNGHSLSLIKKILQSLYHSNLSNKFFIPFKQVLSTSKKTHSSKEEVSFSLAVSVKWILFGELLLTFLIYLAVDAYVFPILPTNILSLPEFLKLKLILETILRGVVVILSFSIVRIFSHLVYTYSKKEMSEITIPSNDIDFLSTMLRTKLLENKKNYVFVIDELDKLKDFSEIEMIIKAVKNIITISNAKFIFICDDRKFYELQSHVKDETPYPESSTYFGWEIFLPSLEAIDIQDYILELLLDNQVTQEIKNKIEALSFYLYTESGGIPSKMKRYLRNFLDYKDGNTYLNLAFLDDKKIKIARIGKIFEQVVTKYNTDERTKQRINHDRKEILFILLKQLIDSKSSFTNKNLNTILDEIKNPAIVSFSATSENREILVAQIIEIFSDINDKSLRGEQLLNKKITAADESFVFSIDINSQVTASVDDVKKDSLTELETQLTIITDKTKEKIVELSKELGNVNSNRILSLLNKDYLPIYESVNSLVKSLDVNKTFDPAVIKNRLNEISNIHEQLSNNNHIYQKYINSIIKSKALAKFNKNTLEINSLSGNYSKIIDSKLFKDTKKFKEILGSTIKNVYYPNTKFDYEYLGNWKTKQIEGNSPQKFDSFDLPISNDNKFKEVSFKLQTNEEYWRIGLVLGANSPELKPLEGVNYTFMHLYKDENEHVIKHKRYQRIINDQVILEPNDIADLGITEDELKNQLSINFKLSKYKKKNVLRLEINDREVLSFDVIDQDIKKATLLVWTDAHKPKEPIVLEAITLLTNPYLKRKKKATKTP